MKYLKDIILSTPYHLAYGVLGVFLLLIAYLTPTKGLMAGIVVSLLPIALYVFIQFVKNPRLPFILVIIANYLIMGLARYDANIPGGIVIDSLLILTVSILIIRTLNRSTKWSNSWDSYILLSSVWLIYCLLLFFNPSSNSSNWAAGIRGIAVYIFLFPFLAFILFDKYKFLRLFLFIWAWLTLFAVLKVMIQKYIGFDGAEKYWLYALDGARTHIIYSGTRYFSFFTDAAAFGCSMGLSVTVFSIYSRFCEQKSHKIFYMLVAAVAFFGMMASGTRAAIFIIFAGYVVFILLSKQWKIISSGTVLILLTLFFFKYTTIGQGNAEIRRMRTAFHKEQDASYQVRYVNQDKMKIFMKDHPLGVGIGNAKRAGEGDLMSNLPTDSSLILIWIETGVVGLVIFLSIFFYTLFRGAYDVFFRIRHRELKGAMLAMLAGISGMLVAGYGSEILQQFPNGPIIYMCMAFVFMGRKFDKELTDGKTN